MRFQSVLFEKCLQILVDERKTRLRTLEKRAEELRHVFQSIRIEPVQEEIERFQVLEGRTRIEQKLQSMYAHATSL